MQEFIFLLFLILKTLYFIYVLVINTLYYFSYNYIINILLLTCILIYLYQFDIYQIYLIFCTRYINLYMLDKQINII